MSESSPGLEAEDTEMRLKPSEVRIVNAIRTLTPQSRIHISKQENGDLNVQTHERLQAQGHAKPGIEAGATPHKIHLRD